MENKNEKRENKFLTFLKKNASNIFLCITCLILLFTLVYGAFYNKRHQQEGLNENQQVLVLEDRADLLKKNHLNAYEDFGNNSFELNLGSCVCPMSMVYDEPFDSATLYYLRLNSSFLINRVNYSDYYRFSGVKITFTWFSVSTNYYNSVTDNVGQYIYVYGMPYVVNWSFNDPYIYQVGDYFNYDYINFRYNFTGVFFDWNLEELTFDNFTLSMDYGNSELDSTSSDIMWTDSISLSSIPIPSDLQDMVSYVPGSYDIFANDIAVFSVSTDLLSSICDLAFYDKVGDNQWFYNNGYNTALTDIQTNPNEYDLYTLSELIANYDAGYYQGISENTEDFSFSNLFSSILRAPYEIIGNAFNFELFGLNMANLVRTLLSIGLVILIIGIFKKS